MMFCFFRSKRIIGKLLIPFNYFKVIVLNKKVLIIKESAYRAVTLPNLNRFL